MSLGDNMNRRYFGKGVGENDPVLSAQQKKGVLGKLAKAADGEGERASLARYAQGVLENKIPAQVDKCLAECANHEDIFLRELVAMALNFWDGPLTEPTLLMLSRDEGKGLRIEITDAD